MIEEVKIQYLVPLYNLNNVDEIPLEDLHFKINDQLFLEILLTEIRGKTISYASYKKNKTSEREKQLMSEIQNLEERETQVEVEAIENKKTELENIRKHTLAGNMICSRAKWINKGGKPTRYVCNLESRDFISKLIPKLEKEDGIIIEEQLEILKETEKCYKSFYYIFTVKYQKLSIW